jgi:hypothetical protein
MKRIVVIRGAGAAAAFGAAYFRYLDGGLIVPIACMVLGTFCGVWAVDEWMWLREQRQ